MVASGIRDVIHDGQEGLLVDTDQQMAGAIVYPAGSSRTRLRIAGHNRLVAPPFDWPEMLQRTQRESERAATILGQRLPVEPILPDADRPRVHSRAVSSA